MRPAARVIRRDITVSLIYVFIFKKRGHLINGLLCVRERHLGTFRIESASFSPATAFLDAQDYGTAVGAATVVVGQ